MRNPGKHGLASRFDNPWEHYVEPVFEAARHLAEIRPDLVYRVYLANDLSFLLTKLVEAGCEFFLNSAIFPRVAKEGILTLLSRRDVSQTYWFALDIEFCMKANPDSEIMHWGSAWEEETPGE